MSFFDQSKVDQLASNHQKVELEEEERAKRKKLNAKLLEEREQEEFNLFFSLVNDALDEFPSMAQRSGVKCKAIRYGANLVPMVLWPKINVWKIDSCIYIDKNGTTYFGGCDTDQDGFHTFMEKRSRKIAIINLVSEIGRFDIEGHKRLVGGYGYDPVEEYVNAPPIDRAKAKELVVNWFMKYL